MITPRSSVSDVEKKLESQEQPALSLAEADEILNSVSILRRFSKKECQIMAKGLGDYHLINKDTREINKTPSVEENIFTFKKAKQNDKFWENGNLSELVYSLTEARIVLTDQLPKLIFDFLPKKTRKG